MSITCQACSAPGVYGSHASCLGCWVLKRAESAVPEIEMNQLLLCPGAIRLVESTIGKDCPSEDAASQARMALSHVSHGTIRPFASGRSTMIFESSARTRVICQLARKGTWSTCIPRSPIEPYLPLNAIWRFQLIGLLGSRSLLCQKPASTSIIRPKRPSRIHCPIRYAPGKNGNSEEQRTSTCG